MRTRLIVACACVIFVHTLGAWAAENERVFGAVASASVETLMGTDLVIEEDRVRAWIHPKMSAEVTEKLQAAVRLAAERIEEVEECGELFSELGADGRTTLKNAIYLPVNHYNRRTGICRRAVIYTYVRARPTFVCPEFSELSDERAAMFVVHEALHGAGLTEKPLDPRARTSLEINAMVSRKCGF